MVTKKQTISGSAYLVYSTNGIDKSVKDGSYALAIIKASVLVEQIMFTKLMKFLQNDYIKEIIERWTLGSYNKWCGKFNIIEKDMLQKIIPLIKLRNQVAHWPGHLEVFDQETKENPNEVLKILKDSKEFIISNDEEV